ncbi:MAG: SDR family oxidoreductase [Gammaproteobacteria bacterium]|jgi:nucleoside-diphosphate-sugar epimerase|nr:SDR family oxidoreductase [Gammaproteobacteria bacterium]
MDKRKVAVIGASGVVGRALLENLNSAGEPVIGLSRRPPADLPEVDFLPLDLLDRDACLQASLSNLQDVTHVVYTALYEKPGLIAGWREQDQMQTNLSMLKNLLEPMRQNSNLRHVTLLQGTKAYGAHVEPMKIPGLERAPRHQHDNFYWLQQDYLEETCQKMGWQFTIWRPQVIFGYALHAPMNLLNAIGVYGALKKSRNEPFTYPGGPSGVAEAIDADLLARAINFSFDNSAFANETFNITNGDIFRWQDIWPALAAKFDLGVGEPVRQRLSETLYDCEQEWQQIVIDHDLIPYTIRELVGDSFFYADALFNSYGDQAPPPALVSTIKLREAGFQECIDTEAMFANWFDKLRALRVLPPI